MTDEPRPSFYDAIDTRSRGASLGRVFTVLHVPTVRQYILYKEYLRRLQKSSDEAPLQRISKFSDWIATVIGRDGVANILPGEVIDVINAAGELYADPPLMEWQKVPELQVGQKPPDTPIEDNLDYDGRQYSITIAMLSRTFGWTDKHILDEMNIYELGIFSQEAMLINHREREWDYVLSESIGFKKVGDNWIKQPMPSLPWVKKRLSRSLPGGGTLTPIPEKYLPGGGTEVWKDGVIVSKQPAEAKVQGMRLNAETGKVENYEIKWPAADAGVG